MKTVWERLGFLLHTRDNQIRTLQTSRKLSEVCGKKFSPVAGAGRPASQTRGSKRQSPLSGAQQLKHSTRREFYHGEASPPSAGNVDLQGSKYQEDHDITIATFSFFSKFVRDEARRRNEPSFALGIAGKAYLKFPKNERPAARPSHSMPPT